jgi:hypothetical protein
MSSQEPSSLPPGTGVFRPGEAKERFEPGDHMRGWSIAVQNALDNFGRAPGKYAAQVTLTATVEVTNPGNVVEYMAKFGG